MSISDHVRPLTCGIDYPHSWGPDSHVAHGRFQHKCDVCGTTEYWTPKLRPSALNAARRDEVVNKLPVLNIVTAIPPEVEQYAEDIRRFVDAMVHKLSVHADKGRWENMPITRAEELLKGEVEELTEAIGRGNLVEILLEAADVGNYALIISAIAIERGK